MIIESNDQIALFDDASLSASPDATPLTIAAPDNRGGGGNDGDEPAITRTPPSTLAEALAFVQVHNILPTKMLDATRSAVNVLVKVTGKTADQLPAAPKELTPLIEEAFPARYRIKPKRWSNATSLIRALLRACGLHANSCQEGGRRTALGRRFSSPCRSPRSASDF